MSSKRTQLDFHKDDVVESTTSRPLHTVGTTLEADAATQKKEKKNVNTFVLHRHIIKCVALFSVQFCERNYDWIN